MKSTAHLGSSGVWHLSSGIRRWREISPIPRSHAEKKKVVQSPSPSHAWKKRRLIRPFFPGIWGEGGGSSTVRAPGHPRPRKRKIKGSLLLRVFPLPAFVREASLAPGLSEGKRYTHTHSLFPRWIAGRGCGKNIYPKNCLRKGKEGEAGRNFRGRQTRIKRRGKRRKSLKDFFS